MKSKFNTLFKKFICLILVFIFVFSIFPLYSNAISVDVKISKLDSSGAIIHVASDVEIYGLKMYVKDLNNTYKVFFISSEENYKEKNFLISKGILSDENSSVKVIVTDRNGNQACNILDVPALPDKPEPTPSQNPVGDNNNDNDNGNNNDGDNNNGNDNNNDNGNNSDNNGETNEVTRIKLNKTSITLDLNGTKSFTLKATIFPNNSRTKLKWSTSNSNVASINSKGVVTAKKVGSAVITVKTSNNKTASCTVKVKDSTPVITQTRANFLSELAKISNQVKKDGDWSYYNGMGTNGRTFSQARKKKRHTAQCAALSTWGLIEIGVLKSGQHLYSNGRKIVWSSSTEKAVKKYAKVIKVNKTPNQLLKSGNLKPGDICLWTFQHTNIYAGNRKWYDAGHAACIRNTGPYNYDPYGKSGFGPISTGYMNSKILYIIRLNK